MPRTASSRDITGQLILLGTGTSVGVPMLGCDCEVCRSTNLKNKRTRCSLVVGLPEGNLLVDTSPDLRMQLLREGVGVAHAVVYTHEHADHTFGLDDLRLFQFYIGGPVPLYCEETVERHLRQSFYYAFQEDVEQTHTGSVPRLEFQRIGTEPFDVLGARVIPIRLKHGPRFDVLGFRFGDIAYCTDVNEIPPESWPLLEGLDTLILDALRYDPHPTHLSLDEAVAIAERIGAERTYFTHLTHAFDHEKVNAALPASMELAYDGLSLDLSAQG